MTTVQKPARPHSVRLRVSDEELEWLRARAQEEERSIAMILRRALREFVEKHA